MLKNKIYDQQYIVESPPVGKLQEMKGKAGWKPGEGTTSRCRAEPLELPWNLCANCQLAGNSKLTTFGWISEILYFPLCSTSAVCFFAFGNFQLLIFQSVRSLLQPRKAYWKYLSCHELEWDCECEIECNAIFISLCLSGPGGKVRAADGSTGQGPSKIC